MTYRIPFIKPSFPSAEKIVDDYTAIVASNWFTNFGPFEQKFSKKISEYIGSGVNVCTVANATLGLQIAISIIFEKNILKNKVLIPSFTFAAGPEMLILNNFSPVFIDIDKDSWQPNINQAKAYLNNNKDVAGVLLCNIFGVGNRDIGEWEKLAAENNIPLIIDSAAGFGSEYSKGSPVGSRGDCEIFSLHATKPFAVGEGGLIVSRNLDLINSMKHFENFGFDDRKKISIIGTNAKLQELNCAIGLRQLEDFKQRLAHRQNSLQYYKQKLSGLGYLFQDNDNLSTVPFVSTLAPSALIANNIEKLLVSDGVEVRKYYSPLHKQDVLMGYSSKAGALDVTEDFYGRILSLPLHDSMQKSDIDRIVDVMRDLDDKTKS